jgi:hypothetical protein
MFKVLVFPLVVCLSVLYAGIALADPEPPQPTTVVVDPLLALITDDDLFSVTDLSTLLDPPPPAPATQHYGPFPSTSPDSGCGVNEWAMDTFDRHFTVRANADGSFTIVEQFKNGSFVTEGSMSPGEQCPENNEPGSTDGFVRADVTGTLHGYEVIQITGSQTSMDSSCIAGSPLAPCTTSGFLDSHFAVLTEDIPTFFFHYAAGDQDLVENEWKNASSDRGGNSGDIASTDPD